MKMEESREVMGQVDWGTAVNVKDTPTLNRKRVKMIPGCCVIFYSFDFLRCPLPSPQINHTQRFILALAWLVS